jgi:hypothetical protein
MCAVSQAPVRELGLPDADQEPGSVRLSGANPFLAGTGPAVFQKVQNLVELAARLEQFRIHLL